MISDSNRTTSIGGKIWKTISDEIPQSCSDVVRILLKNRGFEDIADLRKITLRNTMPDPLILLDMDKAVERVVAAIYAGEKITIMGDYDVDGVSSTVLFLNFFEHINVPCSYSIPNRMENGYGLSIDSIKNYKDNLLIAVDCGSSSFDELKYARSENVDLIVIDHHTMESVPSGEFAAVALVNPHRPDESGDYGHLCAAGVVFLCLVAINRSLREKGFYKEHHIKEPDLFDYLDLVALATVCDVMPLVGLNRAFVLQGIKAMQRGKNLGIDALLSQNKTSTLTADTISFFFGPKINVAGRLAAADISVKLLSTKNPIEAKNIADKLDAMNKERQALEQEIVNEAAKQIDEKLNFICVFSDKWHPGIVGIVAGRLKESYRKPSLVISLDSSGNGRGSCRSIPSVNIAGVIRKAVQKGILNGGGGHAMAAGFSIHVDKISEFVEFLKEEISYEENPEEVEADCYLPAELISLDMMDAMAEIGPFGNGNKVPKFILPNLRIVRTKVVGRNHMQVVFEGNRGDNRFRDNGKCNAKGNTRDNDGGSPLGNSGVTDSINNAIVYGICFRSVGNPIGNVLLKYSEDKNPVDALGSFSVSEWNGRKTISFVLEDIVECQR